MCGGCGAPVIGPGPFVDAGKTEGGQSSCSALDLGGQLWLFSATLGTQCSGLIRLFAGAEATGSVSVVVVMEREVPRPASPIQHLCFYDLGKHGG